MKNFWFILGLLLIQSLAFADQYRLTLNFNIKELMRHHYIESDSICEEFDGDYIVSILDVTGDSRANIFSTHMEATCDVANFHIQKIIYGDETKDIEAGLIEYDYFLPNYEAGLGTISIAEGEHFVELTVKGKLREAASWKNLFTPAYGHETSIRRLSKLAYQAEKDNQTRDLSPYILYFSLERLSEQRNGEISTNSKKVQGSKKRSRTATKKRSSSRYQGNSSSISEV